MRPVSSKALLALSLSLAAASLVACGGGDGSSSKPAGGTEPGNTDAGDYADGKTFTLGLSSDPGALDPHLSAASGLFQLSQFAYDALVSMDAEGAIHSQLASEWTAEGKKVSFTIADGITCADGAPFTAETVVKNIEWVSDPANKSPFLGVYLPAGAKASADGSVVNVKLAAPSPFVLAGFSNLPMVCDAGFDDRASLKDSTAGTGPFTLTEAVPGDHYTYEVREGYTWGPDGAATSAPGTPAVIIARVVTNETTKANQLIAGELNGGAVIGADAERLLGAGLAKVDAQAVIGEQWYNHDEGHATADPLVRQALTQALDLDELQKVLTSGKGGPATQLAVAAPAGCTGSSAEGNVPTFDAAAAGAALDEAGWTMGADGVREKDGKPLTIAFLNDSALGAGGAAAAELAVAAWKEIGVDAKSTSLDTSGMQASLFGKGDWDVAWEPLNVSTPDQIVPFLSGPGLADGGTNFSGIDNPDYSAAVEAAMAKNGAEGCADWLAAESALFAGNDMVIFANNLLPFFMKGAEMEVIGSVVATSIKMLK